VREAAQALRSVDANRRLASPGYARGPACTSMQAGCQAIAADEFTAIKLFNNRRRNGKFCARRGKAPCIILERNMTPTRVWALQQR